MRDDASLDRVRLDKWLWAARFFKTRSLAAQAIEGGRVRLNGERVKPAKELRLGSELVIHIGELEWVVAVRALSMQRRGAPEARTLYEETEASRARRAEALERRKLAAARFESGRPTKRDRRMIERLRRG